MRLILASNSPRRKELLAGLGIPYDVFVLQGIDESYPPTLPAHEVAEYIARKKAKAYKNFNLNENSSLFTLHSSLLLTADTIVVCDGEMTVDLALDQERRDEKYPFLRLHNETVNSMVFTSLSAANSAYKLIKQFSPETEVIGPIQMGLNKPIHFTDFDSGVRDIVNITAVAVIDAYIDKLARSRR